MKSIWKFTQKLQDITFQSLEPSIISRLLVYVNETQYLLLEHKVEKQRAIRHDRFLETFEILTNWIINDNTRGIFCALITKDRSAKNEISIPSVLIFPI